MTELITESSGRFYVGSTCFSTREEAEEWLNNKTKTPQLKGMAGYPQLRPIEDSVEDFD